MDMNIAMRIITDALQPTFDIENRFRTACQWVPENHPSRDEGEMNLGTLWYLTFSHYTELHKSGNQNVVVLNEMAGLAERFHRNVVDSYIRAGCKDLAAIALCIENDIDYELALSLKA